MKRPAAAASQSSKTKKSKTANRSAPTPTSFKRTNTLLCATIKRKKCIPIISQLKLGRMDGIPKELLKLADRIKVGLTTKGTRHLDPETAVTLLGKALSEISNALQHHAQELKIALDNASQGKRDREEAAAAAEDDLAAKRNSYVDSKAALKQAAREIDVQLKAVEKAKLVEKVSEVETKKVHDRKRTLAVAQHSAFHPLREAIATGSKGRKCLDTLRRVGKTFGFHDELLKVAPMVMKKKLEARRTFDTDVLQHITREFEKNSKSMDTAVQEASNALVECRSSVQLANERALVVKAVQKECEKEHAAMEQAVVDGRHALTEAKRQLRSFLIFLNQASKRYERAERQLQSFRAGPMADYEKAFGPLSRFAIANVDSEARKAVTNEMDAEEEEKKDKEVVKKGSSETVSDERDGEQEAEKKGEEKQVTDGSGD